MSGDHDTVVYRLVQDHPEYRVGDDGSAWSCQDGTWKRVGFRNTDGYWRVAIPSSEHRSGYRQAKIPTLVLEAFVGPKPAGHECCHRDDDKDNNAVSNLYWGTHSQNLRDRKRNGKDNTPHGANHTYAKLTDDNVRAMRRIRDEEGLSFAKLGKMFDVTTMAAFNAATGKTWKHVK